jgi:hypothetical protein
MRASLILLVVVVLSIPLKAQKQIDSKYDGIFEIAINDFSEQGGTATVCVLNDQVKEINCTICGETSQSNRVFSISGDTVIVVRKDFNYLKSLEEVKSAKDMRQESSARYTTTRGNFPLTPKYKADRQVFFELFSLVAARKG